MGYLITTGLWALGVGLALRPAPRSWPWGIGAWALSAIPNESPFLACYWVTGVTLLAAIGGDLEGATGTVGLGFALVPFVGAWALVRRSLQARGSIERGLDESLGLGWRQGMSAAWDRRRVPWVRAACAPLPILHPGVARIPDVSYGDAGRRNRLDLYRRRRGGSTGPVLVHFHGGGFTAAPGRKSFYARRLLFRLARSGWVCISANYRLRPDASFPENLIDVKRVVAWARANVAYHGGDPERIVLCGSSFGANLASIAGFTANDPTFQPGFERDDTSVAAVIGLYGYYGPTDRLRQPLPSSPFDYVDRGSPPMLLFHGSQDTFTSPRRAKALAALARERSSDPVAFVELPGAQHSFDLLTSIRFEAVIDGIESFVDTVTGQRAAARPPRPG